MVYVAVNSIIDFFENADESADRMLRCMRKTIDNSQLDCKRVSCFYENNATCNFETKHSSYANILALNYCLIKANSNAPILHNSVKRALQNMNIDVENILKIYVQF